jgi:hypothetical protein
MPAVSEKQKRFMDAAAHNPAFAKEAGVPVKVAKDFSESSKGMKFGKGLATQPKKQAVNNPKTNHGAQALFSKGGNTMDKSDIKQDKAIVKKAFGMHDKQSHEGKKTDLSKLAKGGMAKGEHPVQKKAKEGAKIVKMARGGGVEVKGKTKGKMIAMCGGGMSKKK